MRHLGSRKSTGTMGKVAEVKIQCGFLRRLEDEGLQVFMN
jgi:hypothetical protein